MIALFYSKISKDDDISWQSYKPSRKLSDSKERRTNEERKEKSNTWHTKAQKVHCIHWI